MATAVDSDRSIDERTKNGKKIFPGIADGAALGQPCLGCTESGPRYHHNFDGGKPTVMQESKMPVLQSVLKKAPTPGLHKQ